MELKRKNHFSVALTCFFIDQSWKVISQLVHLYTTVKVFKSCSTELLLLLSKEDDGTKKRNLVNQEKIAEPNTELQELRRQNERTR